MGRSDAIDPCDQGQRQSAREPPSRGFLSGSKIKITRRSESERGQAAERGPEEAIREFKTDADAHPSGHLYRSI